MAQKSAEGTATLDKALDVLDTIGRSGEGLSQAEIAERLQMPRTTVYRLLGTLVDRGLLRRDPLRRVYCLGFRCFEYARQAYSMPDLVAAASVELRSLRDLTGETTYLATLDGLEVLSLERVDGVHSHRSAAALGQRKPLHCTSQGKAILSALDAAQRDAIIKDLPMSPLTPHTITDRRRLQAELKVTAARGYAIDDEEILLGVRCCGAPVIDSAGNVRGAISVAAPAFRMPMERVELLGPEIAQAARRIGAQLAPARSRVREGPVDVVESEWAFNGGFPRWSQDHNALYWADTLAPAVHRLQLGTNRCIAAMESPIEAMLLHADGLAVGTQDGWWLVNDAGEAAPMTHFPLRRYTALCTSPDGTAWCCVPDGSRWSVGALLPGGEIAANWQLGEPVTALAWAADGEQLYAAGSDSGTLYVMRIGSPTVRRLASVPKGSGRLSGLAADRSGGVWSALREGWSVVRFAADGSLDRVIGLPVPCPTDLAFAGAAGNRLYVVTGRGGLTAETLNNAPLSGRVFEVHAEVEGLAPAPLA